MNESIAERRRRLERRQIIEVPEHRKNINLLSRSNSEPQHPMVNNASETVAQQDALRDAVALLEQEFVRHPIGVKTMAIAA